MFLERHLSSQWLWGASRAWACPSHPALWCHHHCPGRAGLSQFIRRRHQLWGPGLRPSVTRGGVRGWPRPGGCAVSLRTSIGRGPVGSGSEKVTGTFGTESIMWLGCFPLVGSRAHEPAAECWWATGSSQGNEISLHVRTGQGHAPQLHREG